MGRTAIRPRVGLLLVLLILCTGCALTPAHARRASDGWSNGLFVGIARLNQPVATQVDGAGEVSLVWVGDGHQLLFAHLNRQAGIVTQHPLDLAARYPMYPQLLLDPDGSLHLFWSSASEEGGLFHVRLDREGNLLTAPARIIGPEEPVQHSRAVFNPALNRLELFWTCDRPGGAGIHHLALSREGKVAVPDEVIIPEGLELDAQSDRDGFVHLAWTKRGPQRTLRVMYAVFDPAGRFLSEGTEIGSLRLAPGQVLHGPVVGMDQEYGYVFWAIESRARESMISDAFQVSFPLGQLERSTVSGVDVEDENGPQFDPDLGRFNYYYTPPHEGGSGMVPISAAETDFVSSPSVAEGQRAELVAAFNTRIYARNRDALQIAVATFSQGEMAGYEVVNDTYAASLRPAILAGPSGYYHLVWIDTAGFDRYQVIYASTSPSVREVMNRLTPYDVVDAVLGFIMSSALALFFVPIALSWTIAPILWLTLTPRLVGVDRQEGVGLGGAMLLQLASKLVLFPSILTRLSVIPAMASPAGRVAGRWLLPAAISVLAAGGAWLWKKRRSGGPFAAYFLYAAGDGLLSLLTYIALPLALGYG